MRFGVFDFDLMFGNVEDSFFLSLTIFMFFVHFIVTNFTKNLLLYNHHTYSLHILTSYCLICLSGHPMSVFDIIFCLHSSSFIFTWVSASGLTVYLTWITVLLQGRYLGGEFLLTLQLLIIDQVLRVIDLSIKSLVLLCILDKFLGILFL